MTWSEVTRILKNNKCEYLGHDKRHDRWLAKTGKIIEIPRHPAKEAPTGTVSKIFKDAGIKK